MAGHSDSEVSAIRNQITTRLAGRTGTWLASFAELVAVADDAGVPVGALQTHVTSLLGSCADGEVHDDEDRAALIDALVGRRASIAPRTPRAIARPYGG